MRRWSIVFFNSKLHAKNVILSKTINYQSEDNDIFVGKGATAVLAKPLDMKKLEKIFKDSIF